MKTEDNNSKTPWWQPGMLLFFRLSGWIGVPVLIGVVVGKWLDRKYGTEPWLFLLSVGSMFIISMFGMIRDAMKAMKEIDKNTLKSEAQNPKSETKSKFKS